MTSGIAVASLGLFILDTFEWRAGRETSSPDDPASSSSSSNTTVLRRDEGVIGGGGTYAVIGARIWLAPDRVGIVVDRGNDWRSMPDVETKLDEFGRAMWVYRDKEGETTKALNLYTGQHRGEPRAGDLSLPSPRELVALPRAARRSFRLIAPYLEQTSST